MGAYETGAMAALGITGALLGLSLLLRNQFLGLALLVVTATALPLQYHVGDADRSPLNSSFFLAALICAVWLLDVFVLRRVTTPAPIRVRLAAWALMASSVISFVVAQFTSLPSAPQGAQFAQVLIFLVSGTLLLIAGDLIKTMANLERLTSMFIIAGALVCIGDVIPKSSAVDSLLDNVWHMPTVGSVFWTWLVALSLSQTVFNRQLAPPLRLGAGAITALALFRGLVLARSWTSGWLPCLVVVFVVFLFRLPRLTIFAGVLAGLTILYVAPYIDTFTPEDEQYSAMTRHAAAETIWPLIKANPVAGMGPANYYYRVQSTPILGWYVRFNTHNQYLDLAAQLGAPGIITFFWLMYEIAAVAWRLRTNFHGDFGEAYVVGGLAGLGATVVSGALADWILPFYYNIGLGGLRSSLLFWIFAGGILVLRRVEAGEAGSMVSPEAVMLAEPSFSESAVPVLRRSWTTF
jgi:hypothetical protein